LFLWPVIISAAGQAYFLSDHVHVSPVRSGDYITTIFEDSRGLIWLGTPDGLARYDGSAVRSYKFSADDTEVMITSLAEDENGNLWCATRDHGVVKLPYTAAGFGRPEIYSLPVRLLCFDTCGNAWGVTTSEELFCFRRTDRTIFRSAPGTMGEVISVNTAPHAVWIATNKGLLAGDPLVPGRMVLVSPHAYFVGCATPDRVYFDADGALLCIARKDGRIHRRYIPLASGGKDMPHYYKSITAPPGASFLVAASTGRGLVLIDKISGKTQKLNAEEMDEEFDISTLACSRAGVLYVGTSKGLMVLRPANDAFSTYTAPESIGGRPWFRCVAAKGTDTLLFGTRGQGILQYVRTEQGSWKYDRQIIFNLAILSNTVNRLRYDSNGRLVAATNYGVFHEARGHWEQIRCGLSIWALAQDSLNNFWVSTLFGSVSRYDPAWQHKTEYGSYSGIEVWNAKCVNNLLYAATSRGVISVDPVRGRMGAPFRELGNTPVWDFYPGDPYWLIPTHGKGLWIWSGAKKRMQKIPWSEDHLFSAEQDGQGFFWIINDKGVSRLDPRTLSGRVFSKADGLHTDYLSFVGIGKASSNEMIFCGENGFTVADIGRLDNEEAPGNIHVTSVKYSGKEIADFPPGNAELVMPYRSGVLTLEWTALHAGLDRGGVLYRMDGVESEWQQGRLSQSVSYSNLYPGTYTFRAFRTDAHNSETYNLRLVILPPFWQRLWFRISVIASGLLLLGFIAYTWVARQRLQQAKLRSNMDALRSQMNPHFVFNALNSIQAFIYDENKITANEYLSRFAKLIRLILENSREETITVSGEAGFLELYLELESVRFPEKLTYAVRVSPECGSMKIPSMLLQPVVENAIKHGFRTDEDHLHIDVHFHCKGDRIICEVTDSGPGFSEHPAGQERRDRISLGLKLITERLTTLSRIHKKEHFLLIRPVPGGIGTYVQLNLPFYENHSDRR